MKERLRQLKMLRKLSYDREHFLHTDLSKDKDKDKEALFNVAYNVTDNISS